MFVLLQQRPRPCRFCSEMPMPDVFAHLHLHQEEPKASSKEKYHRNSLDQIK